MAPQRGSRGTRTSLTLLAAPANALAVEVIDNTGDSDVPDPTYVPLVPNAAETAQKLQDLAALRPQVLALMAGLDPSPMCVASLDSSGCERQAPPPAKTLGGVTIFKQEAGNTCAPASARSALRSLGVETNETSLKTEMGTKADGTYWLKLRDTLNRRQIKDNFIGEPENSGLSPTELMSRVVYDVTRVRNNNFHPAILNVDQYRFDYWGDPTKKGQHYLISYGYDAAGAGKLVIGDVARNHHGSQTVPLTEAHSAVVANKGLVLF